MRAPPDALVGAATAHDAVAEKVAHTGRNLLMSARGYAELIVSGRGDLPRHVEWAGRMLEYLDRLGELLESLPPWRTRVEAASGRVALGFLLRAAAVQARRRARTTRARLHLREEVDGIEVPVAAKDLWVETLASVLEEALLGEGAGGDVECAVRRSGWSFRVVVTPSRVEGCGASASADPQGPRAEAHWMSPRQQGPIVRRERIPGGGTQTVIMPRANARGGDG